MAQTQTKTCTCKLVWVEINCPDCSGKGCRRCSGQGWWKEQVLKKDDCPLHRARR